MLPSSLGQCAISCPDSGIALPDTGRHDVEVGHCLHNLLPDRDRELRCILQQFPPIKPLQVQLIGVDCATFLSPQVDPIQQGFLWLGDLVFAYRVRFSWKPQNRFFDIRRKLIDTDFARNSPGRPGVTQVRSVGLCVEIPESLKTVSGDR